MLKEINRALNQNNNTSYTIPQNRDLIAQEFLLFENSGSDDLSEIVDSRFTKTRITIKMPWVDAVSYIPFLNKLQSILDDELSSYATNQITGTIPMMVRTVVASLNSTVDSYIISYGFITILMILLLGDIKLGLISMIPNITPVIVGLSAMLVFGMNLDMFTILIGAIAIGLAVDDTIHFMHNFKRYYHKSADVDKSIILTLTSTGRAMFMTTVILSLGFFIYMFSNMSNIFNFGAITGIVIIVALLADFILLPALLKVAVKSR
jgi:predicted RND superfamily exporter protein